MNADVEAHFERVRLTTSKTTSSGEAAIVRLSRNALPVSWPWIGDDSSRMLPGSEVLGSYEHYTLIERVCGQDTVMNDMSSM